VSAREEDFAPELRFLRALWELDHALESASRRMKATFGVTGRERLFIRFVGQRAGISPGELADVLHVHPSSITAMLKRLERRGLVSRRADLVDGRSFRLALTRRGERIQATRAGTIEAAVRDALAAIDPDAASAAGELLVEVARRLAAPARDAARGARRSARPAARRRRGG
jgi:DNA-binding MarR family transcriptional regulator